MTIRINAGNEKRIIPNLINFFESYEYLLQRLFKFNLNFKKTDDYFHESNDKIDYRNLINGKKDTTLLDPYTQVFGYKHGFINNLSILDLLFNEGKYALDYLKSQKI